MGSIHTTIRRHTQHGSQVALALILITMLMGMHASLREAHATPPLHANHHNTHTMVLPHTARAHHATIVLTTCDETTLRTAITNAAAGDTIQFNMSSPCTITLTAAVGGTLVINKDLTLDASGSPQLVTLSGGDAIRVLQVNNDVTFTPNVLTIAHGKSSGDGGAM